MLKIKLLFVILLLLLNSALYPQKRNVFTSINNLMSKIPDSLTRSTSGIAGFINSNLNNQKDKAYAIYYKSQ
jgi:predicted PurR-regulated permease PerM